MLFIAAVVVFTLIAAVTDLRTRKLPNWLTVPGFVAGLLFHIVTGGWNGLGFAAAGFATGFGILLVLWLIGGGGGGDVKLMGALGAWLGARYTVYVFLLSTLFAVIGSLLIVVNQVLQDGYVQVRKRYLNRSSHVDKRLDDERRAERKMQRRLLPYALPVACGTWVVLAYQFLMQQGQ
jgi:prepilin peptidase CpaA